MHLHKVIAKVRHGLPVCSAHTDEPDALSKGNLAGQSKKYDFNKLSSYSCCHRCRGFNEVAKPTRKNDFSVSQGRFLVAAMDKTGA